ncbi:hypothetical protein ABH442_12740, partial [Staphylococcus aureus]
MEKGIFNYDNANVLKLDTNQLNENIKVIDDIFKNYEQIEPTIEVENGNTKLKLNGYFIASIIKSSPDSCVKCYTMFLPFLLI